MGKRKRENVEACTRVNKTHYYQPLHCPRYKMKLEGLTRIPILRGLLVLHPQRRTLTTLVTFTPPLRIRILALRIRHRLTLSGTLGRPFTCRRVSFLARLLPLLFVRE